MKKILILYPHFPPSNLAGVHRPRLFAQHLPSFGWEPTILTVHENYYEEKHDWNLVKLLPQNLRIVKVHALKVGKFRLVGDIGLRAFFQLYKKAKQLIKSEGFDFLYIPIPSFYCALLGRMLHGSTGIKYGIDYIDPWVHHFPGSEQLFSRHWFSTQLAKLLEPVAVKKAVLITGVAAGYYKAVLERNSHLQQQAVCGAMPYGGEAADHAVIKQLDTAPYLFQKKEGILQLVYAGAMLPKGYAPMEQVFKTIADHPGIFSAVEFHFIGTGSRVNDPESFNIKPLAAKYGLYNKTVFEYPERITYLDVLVHLEIAGGIFVLGSTEPHYTPSKIYQAVLSQKPILAVLHRESTAVKVLNDSAAGMVLAFNGEAELEKIGEQFIAVWEAYRNFHGHFDPASVNQQVFEQFSAREVTRQLAGYLNTAIQ